ncbi:hypothetical protein EG327_006289 [Venturia inaequalis]|uniref:DUF7918 domain-containing protein n=1 Tax=Venturia inaequalis TaxID=5025 RepID=A0A8H3Z6B6_VENIN|nr:hypothetical protein EG327_006289 [Venturia inaequalis]
MPEHGLLSCCIELGESNTRLREYDTKYANKTVETYVAIPSQPTPFGIRLNTTGYIAPGLAVYVFIDGVYQSNRVKRNIKQPTLDDPTTANFQLRLGKKEDLLKDGRVIARGWWFEKLNIVPVDSKATINEDILNNIGTIEVVVIRCQDNPKNAAVNPFDFPKLPVLVKRVPAVSDTKSSSRQDRKAASKKVKEKEPSEDGGMGGMFGIFDGAGDDPLGLDGHYDTRGYRSHRFDDRPREDSDHHRRYESPHRLHNPRQRILYDESPKTMTSTDEEHQPKHRSERLVHFESPVAIHSRKPPSDSNRRPSGSQYSRHSRDEPHPHLLQLRRSSLEKKPPRESPRPKYSDTRDIRPGWDERRRNSPVRTRHTSDGRDEHYRRQGRGGGSIHERSRSRSSMDKRGRAVNFDGAPRRSGSTDWNRSSSKDRGRSKDYSRRELRGDVGSARERGWSWSSGDERGRSRDSGKRDRYRKRSVEVSEPELRALAANFLQHVPPAPKQGSRRSRGHRHQSPSPESISGNYTNQHEYLTVRKSSKSHSPQTHNTSPVAPHAMSGLGIQQPSQQAVPANGSSNRSISFFGDHGDAIQQTYLAPRPQEHREPTAEFVAHTFNSNQPHNPTANQFDLGAVPATYGHNMPQPANLQDPFSSQPTLPGRMGSGQQTGNGPWSVNNYPQQAIQGFPESHTLRLPQTQPRFHQTNALQGPHNGQFPLQPYRNTSGPFDHRDPSQYEQNFRAAPTQGKIPNQVDRPSPAPVPAAENPQSLISIIQQLKDLGFISIPGQDNNPRGRKKTTSGHRQACPQNGDRAVNPTCLKHGDHAQSAQQHFATWMSGGNPDPAQGKEWFQRLANEHIACTCEPHQKPGPCTCRSGGGEQGSGSGSKSNKKPDDSNEKKDNNDKQGDNVGWVSEQKDKSGQESSARGDEGKTEAGNNTWGENNQTSNEASPPIFEWGADAPAAGNSGNNRSNSGGSQQNSNWNNTDNNNNNNGWSSNNNDSESKKDKSGSSKSKSKPKKSSTAKEGDKAAPTHEKPYTRSYWKGNETIADLANSGKKRGQHYTMPEDPIYTLSESKAKEFNVRHQVRGGMGLEEKKKTHRPLYLDDLDEPYAVFRFKYRSRDMLKKILGEDIKESPEEFQEWLSALSKEQLIAEMLRKKESGAWKSDDGSGEDSDTGSKKTDKGKVKGDDGDGNDNGGNNNGWNTGDAATGGGGWGDNSQNTTTPAADNSGWGNAGVTSGGVAPKVEW